jgi:molybdenum cofactor cytidylyltransferase
VITGVVLAAGRSSRLGRTKQLLDLAGKPIVLHVLTAALASPLDEVIVVLGHAAEDVAAVVPPNERLRLVVNPDFAEGQSTSLQAALRAADERSEAAVVLLGDQPGVRPEAVRAVVDAWSAGSGPLVQAAYEGRPGHPTVLGRSVWTEAADVEGDEGARSILARYPGLLTMVEVGGEPPDDVDTWADYERVRAAFEPR